MGERRKKSESARPQLPPIVAGRLRVALLALLEEETRERGERGSKTRLAKRLGISQARVSQMVLYGEAPAFSTAYEIARAAGLDLSTLMHDAKLRAREEATLSLGVRRQPNLESCLSYHRDDTRWSPWTIAAARQGLWEVDVAPMAWPARLDALEEHLAKFSQRPLKKTARLT